MNFDFKKGTNIVGFFGGVQVRFDEKNRAHSYCNCEFRHWRRQNSFFVKSQSAALDLIIWHFFHFFIGTNRVGFFGGVQDNEDAESEESDDDGTAGNFFNDILSVNIENERATWTKIELTGKKDGSVKKRKKDGSPKDGVIFYDFLIFSYQLYLSRLPSTIPNIDYCNTFIFFEQEEQEDEEGCDEPAAEEVNKVVTKVVEDGAFTITSTVGLETKNSENKFEEEKLEIKLGQMNLLKGPSPRFGAQMAIKQGILYLFGGLVEDSNDRQFTHKDLYALGISFSLYY